MNFQGIRHPISTVNRRILKIGGYTEKYNPNQTTAAGTIVTVMGTTAYVLGILSGNQELAWAGIGGFTLGRYSDLLDGDHARLLREKGKWNTKSGGIFDADMDKATIYLTLGALAYTNTLPEVHKYAITVEIAIMGMLDGISYGMRSQERSWKKIRASLTDGSWDEEGAHMETVGKKNGKIDANIFGKIKTLLQTLGITALGVGALVTDEAIAGNLQKVGHPLFLSAIGFAGASLWNKMKTKA